MNGSVQRTIPNVMLPFRSMIPKSRSAAYYGSEYQLPHYAATDIFCCVSVIPEACLEYAKRG